MAVKVKVCGMKSEADIGLANDLRPDYVGFIFTPRSRRFIAPEYAGRLRAELREGIKAIGVFVNEPLDAVGMCADVARLDGVQLHGNETEEYICSLREYIRCPIIRAFKVTGQAVIDRAVFSSADYIMFDGGAGEGKPFDWSLLKTVKRPYFLAGGLTPENVENAMAVSPSPYALDVSSGVEINRSKDYRKMMKFIAGVRNYKKAG
ncbi:MAG: phosphoribosylanthranilate isomerase [Fretibacterium sp.]|nr:phosphoribosylanthranilate isomerase [Fretibacterium sp.]